MNALLLKGNSLDNDVLSRFLPNLEQLTFMHKTGHLKNAIKKWGKRACFHAACPLFQEFFSDLREKHSKLDHPEKLFLYCKSY